jgi:hypothetical protein
LLAWELSDKSGNIGEIFLTGSPAQCEQKISRFLELASGLVRFDHVAGGIVNADHSIM